MKTIKEWAKEKHLILLEPSGFSEDVVVYNKTITEEEFDKNIKKCFYLEEKYGQ
jgi:hypothetical protein